MLYIAPMGQFWAKALLILVVGCSGTSSPEAVPPTRNPDVPDEPAGQSTDKLVQLVAVSDVTTVAPGQEFSLGARLDVEPTWHIYWLNPGEAGLPTEAAFMAPAGFSVGAVRYPGPKRFEDPGGVVSYGYEDLAMLSAPVTAPDALSRGETITFTIEASWLACREVCVRGNATGQLVLPVAGPDSPSSPSHAELWQRHLEAVPVPLSELSGASHSFSDRTLTIALPKAERVEYFPSPGEQPVLSGQASVPDDDGVSLRVSYREVEGTKPPESITGVIRVVNDRARYYSIDIPWPEES